MEMLSFRQENLELLKNLTKYKHECKKLKSDNRSYQDMISQYSYGNTELVNAVSDRDQEIESLRNTITEQHYTIANLQREL